MKVEKITAKGILLNVRMKMWGAGTKVEDSKMGDLPKDIVSAAQTLILEEDRDLFEAIKSHKAKVIGYVRAMSLPFPIYGFYMIKKEKALEVNEWLKNARSKYEELVDLMYEKLDTYKRNYRRKQPEFYRPDKYPSSATFKKLFSFTWSFRELAPSDALKAIDESLFKEEQRRWKEEIKEMQDDTIKIIQKEIVDRVSTLRDMCMGKKRLNQGTINGIESILEKWDNLWSGFIGNRQLKQAIADIKANIKGLEADDLRSDEAAKKQVKKFAKEIVSNVEAVSEVKKKRKLIY